MSAVARIFSAKPHRLIGANPHRGGRDFVVADLHGRYAELVDELRRHDFRPGVDRLFSCGDLVDRGPNSLECIKLLTRPWFFAVLGNHEAMLLTLLRSRPTFRHTFRDCLANSASWLQGISPQDKAELAAVIPALEACPLVMTVEHAAGAFNVVHAQLTSRFGTILEDADLGDEVLLENNEPNLTWSRELFRQAWATPKRLCLSLGDGEVLDVTGQPFHPGLRLTYAGHNLLKRSLLHRSHIHIDRGAATLKEGHRVLVLEHSDVMRRLRNAGVVR